MATAAPAGVELAAGLEVAAKAAEYFASGDHSAALLVLSEVKQKRADDPKARALNGCAAPCVRAASLTSTTARDVLVAAGGT